MDKHQFAQVARKLGRALAETVQPPHRLSLAHMDVGRLWLERTRAKPRQLCNHTIMGPATVSELRTFSFGAQAVMIKSRHESEVGSHWENIPLAVTAAGAAASRDARWRGGGQSGSSLEVTCSLHT